MSLYLPICSVSGYYQLLFLRFSRAGHQQGNMMAVRSIHGNDHFLQWQSTHSFTPCQMPYCLLRRCQAIAILPSPRALNLLLFVSLEAEGMGRRILCTPDMASFSTYFQKCQEVFFAGSCGDHLRHTASQRTAFQYQCSSLFHPDLRCILLC